jgi:TonB family protein
MATKVSEQAVRSGGRGGSSDELGVIAQSVQAFTHASGTVIALSEGSAAEIICRARAGSSAPEVGTALRLERTFIGLCIQSGKELRCDDAETDTRVDMAAIRALGIRSMVVVPIKEEGRVVGVVAVFAPSAHAFSITHVGVLKAMADQIAAYLQRRHRNQAHSPEPSPAPPARAVAVSAAAPPVAPPAVATKPAVSAAPSPVAPHRVATKPAVSAAAPPVAPPAVATKPAVSAAASPVAPPTVAIKPAVSAAASPVASPTVAIKPAEPALARRRLAIVPKVEPARGGSPTSPSSRVIADIGNNRDTYTLAEKVDPARLSYKKETSSHHEQKESKTDFRPMFETYNAAAAPKKRLGTNVLMIGAAVLLIIAVAVELSLILRRPAAAPQPAVGTSSPPDAPAAPAPVSANMQPLAKNTTPAPPAKPDETQAKREDALRKPEETVVLSPGPSRISKARDNSAQTSEAPAIFLGYLPAAGSLSNLVIPVLQPPNPRLLRQSDFEPVAALKKVLPVYPEVAKQYKLTGSVVVRGTVNKNGGISDLQLISGSPLFRDAAFAAVKQWVFKPARLNGQAIEQPATIRLYFREKGRPEEPVVKGFRADNQ